MTLFVPLYRHSHLYLQMCLRFVTPSLKAVLKVKKLLAECCNIGCALTVIAYESASPSLVSCIHIQILSLQVYCLAVHLCQEMSSSLAANSLPKWLWYCQPSENTVYLSL